MLFEPVGTPGAAQASEGELFTTARCFAVDKFDLDDPVSLVRIAAIAHVLNEKDPAARDRDKGLSRPLEGKVRRAHDDTGVGPSGRVDVGGRQRHQGFAGAAFSNDLGRIFLLEKVAQALNGERLCRQWAAQEVVQPRG